MKNEEKLEEVKRKAKVLDIPVSTYIKSKIFKEDTYKE
jgi:hypothetical protein